MLIVNNIDEKCTSSKMGGERVHSWSSRYHSIFSSYFDNFLSITRIIAIFGSTERHIHASRKGNDNYTSHSLCLHYTKIRIIRTPEDRKKVRVMWKFDIADVHTMRSDCQVANPLLRPLKIRILILQAFPNRMYVWIASAAFRLRNTV